MDLPAAFGKYHLLERLAVGGMAEVFLAKAFGAAGFERILVIKKILPHMSEDAEFITMFIDEARIASSLSHSNIIQITELGKEENDYYIAMEYVMGKDLSRIYEKTGNIKQTIPIPLAVLIASRICEGLEYAHRKKDSSGKSLNIIHRDVSPGNVLISYDGDVKLIDFGIAKAQMRMGHTSAGTLKGKFGYMSPEQVRGQLLDHRSDIFSVGILLYEILTGEKLFGSQSDFGTLEKVRNARVVPPSTYNSKIPDELERVVMRALAREPEERYEWASDMQEDLVRFLMNEGSLTTSKSLSVFMKDIFNKELLLENKKMSIYRKRGYPWADAAKCEDIKESLDSISSDDPYETAPKTTMDCPETSDSIHRPSTENISDEATQIFYSNPSIPLQAEDPWANESVQDDQDKDSAKADPLSDPRVNQPTIIFDEEELSGESASLDDFDTYEGEETAETDDSDEKLLAPEPSTERKGKPFEEKEVSSFSPDKERKRKQQAAKRRLRAEISNSSIPGTEYIGGRKGRAGPLGDKPEPSRPKPLPLASSRYKQQSTIRLVLLAAIAGLAASGVLGYFLFFQGPPASQFQVSSTPTDLGLEPIEPAKSSLSPELTPRPDTKQGNKQGNKPSTATEPSDIHGNNISTHSAPDTVRNKAPENVADSDKKKDEKSDQTPAPETKTDKAQGKDLLHISHALVIQSIPEGAEIFINGHSEGKTPKTFENLNAAKTYVLRLRKKGYKKYTKEIKLGQKDKFVIKAQLDRLRIKHRPIKRKHRKTKHKGSGWLVEGSGWLVANTTPWAKVIIDGRDTGLWTPLVGEKKIKLKAGRHVVVFKTKDGRKMKVKIKIKPNKTAKIIKKIP